MTPPLNFSRADFEQVLAEYRTVIEATNELEYCVYHLGQLPPTPPLTSCQQAAGTLIGAIRHFLFLLDAQALPALDAMSTATADGQAAPEVQ